MFTDMGHVQATICAVMEHYNAIAKGLAAARLTYTPVLDEDPRSDEILWELWADGFGRAVDLKPWSWAATDTNGDEEARVALAGLLHLVAIARDEGTLASEAIHAFDDTAPRSHPSLGSRPQRMACRQRRRRSPIHAQLRQGRTQRSAPPRIGKKVQEMLRPQLS